MHIAMITQLFISIEKNYWKIYVQSINQSIIPNQAVNFSSVPEIATLPNLKSCQYGQLGQNDDHYRKFSLLVFGKLFLFFCFFISFFIFCSNYSIYLAMLARD